MLNLPKFFQLLALLMLHHVAKAQDSSEELHKQVDDYTQQLQQKGIDTIFVYDEYCTGCIYRWRP